MQRSVDDSYDEAMRAQNLGDYARALHIYENLAKQGHVYSLVMLGDMYVRGEGTAVDLSKAEELFNQAASLGSSEAVFQKANIWLGRGDMRRYFSAIQQAARMGLLVAQYRLGLCYVHGRGTAKDSARALEIIREAAERGHVGAKAHLARQLLARPFNPFGFVRGLILMSVALVEAFLIGIRNPHDDRIR